jgi:hypothetical protein
MDGWTTPTAGYFTDEVTHDFSVIVNPCQATLSVGPYEPTVEFLIGTTWSWEEEVIRQG